MKCTNCKCSGWSFAEYEAGHRHPETGACGRICKVCGGSGVEVEKKIMKKIRRASRGKHAESDKSSQGTKGSRHVW